jgi:hypothetical protein
VNQGVAIALTFLAYLWGFLFGFLAGRSVKAAAPDASCPYCGLYRNRQECINAKMAIGVLPACALGPRADASNEEKNRFRLWLANCGSAQTPPGDS